MKLTEHQITEAQKVYNLFWDSYLAGDVDTFASTLDDKFEMIGTSESERCHTKEDGIEFFKGQVEELVGKAEMRNRQIHAMPVEGMVLINELCDIYVLAETDWNFYSIIRISTFLRETPDGWKVVQQHGSLPDNRVQEGETLAIDKISRENIELRDAVKRRTAELENKNRELEIEAALERVRARAMSMHKSDELNEVVSVLFEKLKELQIPFTAVGIATGIEDSKDLNAFVCGDNADGLVITNYRLPYFDNPIPKDLYNALEKQLDFYVGRYSKEEKDAFYEYVIEHTAEFRRLPEDIKRMIFESPAYTITNVAVKNAVFNINNFEGKELADHEVDIIKRFARVFDQAYTRFLDLQKAEEQVREAEIQLALERVRAKTMAMKTQSDLLDIIELFGEQLNAVGIRFDNVTFIEGPITKKRDWDLWSYAPEAENTTDKILIPYIETPYFTKTAKAVEAYERTGNPIQVKSFTKKEKDEFLDHYWKYAPASLDEIVAYVYTTPGSIIVDAFLKEVTVSLVRWDLEPCTKEELATFERFAKEFRQTYIRFLDIKKAEAQAREAQVNLAVERVRARALAMFESEEILEVVHKLKEEIMGLDIPNVTAATIHLKEPDGKYRAWDLTSISEDENELEISLDIRWHREDTHPDFFMREVWDRTEDYFVVIQGGDRYKHTVQWLHQNGHSDYAEEFEEFLESSQLEKAYHPTVPLNNGRMCIDMLEPPDPEVESILKKMAGAFDLAYKRFEDLQKAEAQTREAKIETALEKVRSRTMGMQRSDELAEVANVLFTEMNDLVHNLWTCGFVLCEKGREEDEWWLSLEDGFSRGFFLPNVNDYAHATLYEGWLEGHLFRTVQLDGDKLQEHYDWLMEIPVAKNIFDDMEAAGMQRPEWQKLHAAYFSKGYLVIITREPCPEEEVFKRFAKVFDQTYTRFLDLKKAEAQARESQIETALEKVRSRTMAMQHSDELIETSELMFEQIKNLNIELWSCGFSLWYDDDSYFMGYNTGPDGKMGDPLKIPLTEDVFFTTIRDAKRRGDDFLVFESEGKSLEETYSYMDTLPVVGEFMRGIVAAGAELPKYQVTHCGFFSHGHLMFIALEHNPEAIDIFKRFTKVFNQTYTRFLDLQKAEGQAREAKIETALEKIRSRTMAMQKGEELQEVAVLLYKELIALGVTNFVTCGYVEVNEEIRRQHTWVTAPGGDTMGLFHLPLTGDDTFDERYAAWKKQQTVFHQSVAGQVRSDHLEYAITTFNSKEAEEMVRSQFPDPTVFYCFNFSHGYLHIVGGSLLEKEEENLLARFTKVFEQTYTRFLDLQKAEEQAREAKIEMSLEKIRSRTMGMQSSDELPEVANMLFLEVQSLDIPAWSCGYCILEEDRRSSICIMSSEGTLQKPFLLPHHGEVSFEEWDDFVHGDQTFFTQELGGKAIESHYGFMKSLPQLTPIFREIEEAGLSLPTYQINHLCKFGHGFLLFITYETVPEAHDIFKRFTRVFDQTYTRFLDLKKAEKQAREAQIENALEKVRSRSLAMQHPDELTEVAQLLREEMGALGVEELETSSIYIYDESSGLTECWFTIKNTDDPGKAVTDQMSIDLQNTWVGRQMHEFYRSPAKQISIVMQGENRVEWIRYCEEKSDLFGTSEFYGETIPERTYHLYKFSNGFLGAASPGNISDESWDLMRRATSVFSFAYTRFSDLQKAEESARRARQQASLDRVRADISGMRSADDLNQITPLIWNELNTLGVPFIRCGVFIIQEDDQQVEVYLSKPDGTSLAVMNLPFGSSELVSQTVDAWQQGSVYTQHWTREEFLGWGRSMIEQGQVSDLESYQGAEEAPDSLHLQFLPFTQGMLYVGSTNPIDQEEISLSESLAKAFSIAYARYEDFVKLEKAKAGIEDALAELKATQSQLVQQEKLASLGQLTAGIAHEIKNPLNFVNNFSDVSLEMIDEALEELGKTSQDDHTSETAAILADIKSNLAKIHEHGSRADSIVKAMLMHSRGGNGKMEPVNLNELVKEYVNLSYHGMRAGKDPIEADIDLQLDESIGEVPLIAEDFSRVILNLCTNAFDACADRSRSQSSLENLPQSPGGSFESLPQSGSPRRVPPPYTPRLTIRTGKTNGTITIEIEDNGPGIPDEIKDKILQPFFTTKKGTQGTGLGLSITNDIIKAHGGRMDINSSPGVKTTFTIYLEKSL